MEVSELCNELLKEQASGRGLDEVAIAMLKKIPARLGELTSAISNPAKIITLSIEIITEELTADQKLDKMMRMHYDKGVSYLKDARLAQEELNRKISMEQWQDAQTIQDEMKHVIRDARDAFQSAAKVDKPLIAAKAEFFVGVCYDLLNLKGPALKHYKEAYVRGQKEVLKKLVLEDPIQHMTKYRTEAFEKFRKINTRMKNYRTHTFNKYGALSDPGYNPQRARLIEEIMNQYLSHMMSAYMLITSYPLPLPKEEIEQINNELAMELLANPEKSAKNIEAFIEAYLSIWFASNPNNRFMAWLIDFRLGVYPLRIQEVGQYEAKFLKPLSVLLSRDGRKQIPQ